MLVDLVQRSALVLVVGRGLIGSAIQGQVLARGCQVVTVAGRGPDSADHRARDLGCTTGRAQLRTDLQELQPRCVVLTHGPSDVSWIEQHEVEATATHCGVAKVVAESGVPAVLVSTDNVFAGERGGQRPEDPIDPGNAYGRVKARAEQSLLATESVLALRISLVYGWTGPRHRSTYAERCLESALADRPILAPTDQVFTPIHVRDVAKVIAELCTRDELPVGVAHLASHEELSRYEFARLAYQLAGTDVDLVRPCLRQDTEWASRPQFSSLICDDFTHVPGLTDWQPMTAAKGLRAMLTERAVAGSEAR